MRQAINIKCWSCKEVFTTSAEPAAQPSPLVDTVVPCPLCGTSNRITIRAGKVASKTLYRGENAAESLDLSRPGALLDRVFDGEKPAD